MEKITNLKILIVSQYFWPENFRINELTCELKKLKHNITVLTGYPNYPEGKIYNDFLNNQTRFSKYKGINIIRVPLIPRGQSRVQLIANYLSFCINASILGLIKLRKKEFDIIFVFQTSPILVGIPSSIISFFKKTPQILWILDLWPETLTAMGILKKKWQIKFVRFFTNLIYQQFNIILTQSKSILNIIRKYTKTIETFYFPAWSESNTLPKSIKIAKEIKGKKSLFTIIFAGNIGEAQDFPSIVKAVSFLVKINFKHFRIITLGNGSKKAWLIKEIKKQKLNPYFEIMDSYPPTRMPSFFEHADALLVSLKDEEVFKMTIPGKIQTYLTTGKPIIGMLSGEGAKVIKEAKAGLVCNSGDYKNLGKLIIKISKMSKMEREDLGKNGLNFCKKEFDRNYLILKLESIMKNLIKK